MDQQYERETIAGEEGERMAACELDMGCVGCTAHHASSGMKMRVEQSTTKYNETQLSSI